MYGRFFYLFNYRENLMKDLAKMVSKRRWRWEKRGFGGKALWNQIISYGPKKKSSPSCKYQWILILQTKWKLWKYYEIQVFWKITDGPMRKFPRVAIGAGTLFWIFWNFGRAVSPDRSAPLDLGNCDFKLFWAKLPVWVRVSVALNWKNW